MKVIDAYTVSSMVSYLLENYNLSITRNTINKLDILPKPTKSMPFNGKTYKFYTKAQVDKFAKRLLKQIKNGEVKTYTRDGVIHFNKAVI